MFLSAKFVSDAYGDGLPPELGSTLGVASERMLPSDGELGKTAEGKVGKLSAERKVGKNASVLAAAGILSEMGSLSGPLATAVAVFPATTDSLRRASSSCTGATDCKSETTASLHTRMWNASRLNRAGSTHSIRY